MQTIHCVNWCFLIQIQFCTCNFFIFDKAGWSGKLTHRDSDTSSQKTTPYSEWKSEQEINFFLVQHSRKVLYTFPSVYLSLLCCC